jgi:hypothetical protein
MSDCDKCGIGNVIVDRLHRYHAPICKQYDKKDKDIPQPKPFCSSYLKMQGVEIIGKEKMEPLEFCKCHNIGARCKFGQSYYTDGTPSHFCKREPCLIENKEIYNKFGVK